MTYYEILQLLRSVQFTTDPQVAADLGYVNPGTDRRLAGELGAALGGLQSAYSFKSATPPVRTVQRVGNVALETAVAPPAAEGSPRVHYTIAVRRANGRWLTLRVGYRFDANWGDDGTIGYNPQPKILGGYIFDLVVKLNAERSFIAAIDHG